jgi:hypothetical protein
MGDLATTYQLTRGRFEDALSGLSADQLNWRLHPGALTLGEMAIHVAGVEIWFAAQLTGESLSGEAESISRAATEGVIAGDFPFESSEITPDFVIRALALGRDAAERLAAQDGPELRAKEIKSAPGPMISGQGALARIAFHPGYHQGQAHLIRSAPGFPI